MSAGVTLAEAGIYQAVVSLRWLNNSSGARHLILIAERGGVAVKERRVVQGPAESGQAWQQVVLWHIAEPGDKIVVKVRQTSTAGLGIASIRTSLDITRMAQ